MVKRVKKILNYTEHLKTMINFGNITCKNFTLKIYWIAKIVKLVEYKLKYFRKKQSVETIKVYYSHSHGFRREVPNE